MTLSAAISRAAMPDRHAVLGVVLLPFCIGHWLILHREGVSFVTGEDHTLDDLAAAVLICSDTFDGFAGSLARGGIGRAIQQWRHRLAGGFLGEWKRRIARSRGRYISPREQIGFNFSAECARFQTYLDEHGAGPSIVNDWSVPVTIDLGKGGRIPKTPWPMVLLDALQSDVGLRTSEAMNMPLPLARWMLAIHAERKGAVEIVDRQQAAEDQRMADEIAARVFAGETV